MSDTLITLSEEQVVRYLQLVDRRMFIVMNSGITWKPEYAQELEDIDREIATLRPAIDAAIAARHLAQGQNSESESDDVALDCNISEDTPAGQGQETVSENVALDCTHSETLTPGQETMSCSGCDPADAPATPGKGSPAPGPSRPGRKPPLLYT